MRPIPTKDKSGEPNGYLIPLWSVNEAPWLRPDQVYVTVVDPGKSKGPHLHMKRRGFFHCISGQVAFILRVDGYYVRYEASPNNGPVIVPPGTPCEIRNVGPSPAFVVNMPSPAWAKDDQDDWPVDDWDTGEGSVLSFP